MSVLILLHFQSVLKVKVMFLAAAETFEFLKYDT